MNEITQYAARWMRDNIELTSLVVLVGMIYLNMSNTLQTHYGVPGINKVLVPAFLLVAIYFQLRRKTDSPAMMLAIIVGAFYFLFVCSSLLYADDLVRVRTALEVIGKNLLIPLVICGLLRTMHSFKVICWCLMILATVMSLLAIAAFVSNDVGQTFGGFHRWTVNYSAHGDILTARVSGQLDDPNFFSQMLLLVIPIALMQTLRNTNRTQVIAAYLMTTAMSVAILCTLSRGGALIMILMFIIYLFSMMKKMLREGVLQANAIVLIFVLIAGSVFVLPDAVSERFVRMGEVIEDIAVDGVVTDGAIQGRMHEMSAAFTVFLDHPILGVGYNNFKNHYQDVSRREGLQAVGKDRSAHSLYLQLLAEGGIAGLLAFLFVCYVAVHCALVAIKRLEAIGRFEDAAYIRGLVYGYIAFLMAAMFLHGAYHRYFWMATGILYATISIATHYAHRTPPAVSTNNTMNGRSFAEDKAQPQL